MENNFYSNDIDLDYIFKQMKINTPYGRDALNGLKTYSIKDLPLLKGLLDDLEKMRKSLITNPKAHDDIEREFLRIKDIRGSVKRCKNQGVLEDIELFEIKLFAIYGENIRRHYEGLNLSIEGVTFNSLEGVIELLDPEGQRSATFSIYNGYSPLLKVIREEKRSIEKQLYIESDSEKIDELKKLRLKWVAEETALEGEIRQQLSQRLLSYIDKIEENISSIAKVDLTLGKAKMAIEMGCTKPLFREDSYHLKIMEGRYPYLEEILKRQGKLFTGVSICLSKGSNAITGPNMGGKSVALKTIALNVILAHMGFYVFADFLQLPAFDFIHLLSNDQESLKGGLSTFGGEVVKFNQYMKDIKESRGLVLMDEFASGTNPNEGRLLVKSLLEYLNSFDTISVFITHFDGVIGEETNHYQVVGLKDVNFDEIMKKSSFDASHRLKIIQNLMDYRLELVKKEIGIPKDALNIAMLLGLDPDVLKIAKSSYQKEVQFYGEETEEDA